MDQHLGLEVKSGSSVGLKLWVLCHLLDYAPPQKGNLLSVIKYCVLFGSVVLFYIRLPSSEVLN